MLYVVRHGQTEWNIETRFQGQQDSPLSTLGQQQAHNSAAYLAGLGIERLYASPLGRAWKTAGVISERIGLDRIAEDCLMECNFGACEGMTFPEIEEAFPGKTAWRDADRWNRPYPNAESYADVVQRVSGFADEILRDALRADGPVICSVAHGMLNRCLVGYLCGWSNEEILSAHQDNDEIFLLTGQGAERIRVPGSSQQSNEASNFAAGSGSSQPHGTRHANQHDGPQPRHPHPRTRSERAHPAKPR